LVNKCNASLAESLAKDLLESVAKLPHVPAQKNSPAFSFTGTVTWGVWPKDNSAWDSLFQGSYDLLLDSWKQGGNRMVHYHHREQNS
jgi:hypothetical protein